MPVTTLRVVKRIWGQNVAIRLASLYAGSETLKYPINIYLNIFFFEEAFKYGNSAKTWGDVRTNAEPLCVELCNFVQCYIFVNCLIYY
jgi:hypothetical protein